MKRWICLLTVVLLAVTALSAAAEVLLPRAETVVDRLAGELPTLLNNDAYVDIYTGAWTLDFDPAIEALAQNTWQNPTFTVFLGCDEARLLAGAGVLPDSVELMRPYIAQALVTMMRGSMEYEVLILNIIGQNNDYYVDADMPEGTVVFLRFYDDGAPLVGMVSSVNGAVSVSVGVIAAADDLENCQSAADVQAWLDGRGMGYILVSGTPVPLPVPFANVAGDTEAARAAALARICAAQMADAAYLRARGAWEAALLPVDADAYENLRLALYMELDLLTQGAVCFGGNIPLALVNDNGPVERRLSLSLPTSYMGMLVSSYGGADDVIAMSSSSVEAMYADPERADGSGAYLFLYEGGGAVWVSLRAHNGVVSMNAELMPLEGLAGCQSASEASLWLMHRTIPAVCTEVNIE